LLTSLFQASLIDEQVAQFQRDGHLIVRGAYKREVLQRLSQQLETARSPKALALDPAAQKDPNAFFWRRSPEIARFVLDPGLGEVVSQLLGVDGVRLIHESLFEKQKATGRVPWHRDSHFWSFEGAGAVTVWIPLQDTPLSMSPLRYASGSHLERKTHQLSRLERVMIPMRYPVVVSPMQLGDLVIHHSLTLHGAACTQDQGIRRALSLHLFDENSPRRFTIRAGMPRDAVGIAWNPGNSFPTKLPRRCIANRDHWKKPSRTTQHLASPKIVIGGLTPFMPIHRTLLRFLLSRQTARW
jgi:ectoine hydroxylase-related dioxygenase (phytanoyl-CoA dioxygenase family)